SSCSPACSTFFANVQFSYEGLRLRQPQTAITQVPSLEARQIAPVQIKPFLDAFPIPNGTVNPTNRFAQFAAAYSNPTTLNATSIRVDHTVSSKLTVFGRYNYAPSETTRRGRGFSLNTLTNTLSKTQTLTGGATLAINPATSNDFRANYSRDRGVSSMVID